MIVPDPHMPHGERTKLLDFGIAKFTASSEQSQARTQISAVMGSPSYMSPEQCRGAAQVDDRTDVYSLGCMLYEMLSGKPPFVSESMAELMARHQVEPPVPLAKRTAGVPPPLLALVDSLLIKDRAQRPAMSQVLEGLETLREMLPHVAQRRSARMPTLRPAVDPTPMPFRNISTLGDSVGQGLLPVQSSRRSWTITILAALVTLAILAPLLFGARLGFQRMRSGPEVKVPPSPPPPDSAAPGVVPAVHTPAPTERPASEPTEHHRTKHSVHSEPKHSTSTTTAKKKRPQQHLILVE